ncbi:MAG: type VI secretion system baseplate subunit TssF [Pseudomonadales bacterium]|nr:type VI secretion system baseplate subunit TssF [Pseudomonadales bacterium]
MAFNRYFHDELSALRELGKEFSLRNPRLAPFLAEEAQDPDVERLLEGVAFLSGRLRQKLDDELPEVTHSLMALLWPSFLKPLPAMSVVQFSPIISLSETQILPRGIEVESIPVDGTACVFRSCYETEINPLEIVALHKHERPKGAMLKLDIELTASVSLTDLMLKKLRFFLHGETHIAQNLYLWLFKYLSNVRVLVRSRAGEEHYIGQLTAKDIKPIGFADNENLLPYSKQVFKGYRLIQEYFALPEKFHFFELQGLELLESAAKGALEIDQAQSILFEFSFDRPFDNHLHIKADNFRLHATPVVNLQPHSAKPIRLDHKRTEYRILPEGTHPDHFEIYSVDKVEGWGHDSREYLQFKRFESFEHVQSVDALSDKRYFRERLAPSMSGHGVDTYLAFVDAREHQVLPETESVSIDLTCSNRHLPAMLSVGDICVDTGTSPEYASFENIMPVTPSFTPPLDKGFHWRLIANMSLNYSTLCDLDSLRTILSTYDYRSFFDRQQARASQHRLDGLDSIETVACERMYMGIPVRGMRTTLNVKESYFSNEGDMYVFLTVLNEFFALYASMNSFHELCVNGLENGEVYQWEARLGLQPLI